MKNKTPIILINSLNTNRGGVTKSVLAYANLLIKKYKKVIIGTFLYQRNHKEIVQKLYEKNQLSKRVTVLNMFEDMKPSQKQINITHKIKEKDLIEIEDTNQKTPSFRYFKDGLYVKYKRFDIDGKLIFIDYMNNARQRNTREEYNSLGLLSRRRHMDLIKNKPRLDQYFDNKKDCYLTTWLNIETLIESRFFLFGNDPREFKSLNELRTLWLNKIIKNINYPVFIIDKRNIDNLMSNIQHHNLKTIAVLHNNYYKKPYTNGSDIKSSFHFLFNNTSLFDKIICLTEAQKIDIFKDFNIDNNKVEVISHAVESVDNRILPNQKEVDSYTAVSIARYVKQKRLDEAIRAFRLVVNKIPNAQYHIYGQGAQQEKLQKLIDDLNLQNNVKLKGYTNDAYNKLSTASCSILTSDFEGFGRVVSESLYAGTPVVSYNINYGPPDIIRNNIDGYLVAKGDREALAEKVIDIFNDEKLRKKLSERALEIKERFSYNKFEKKWLDLLNRI